MSNCFNEMPNFSGTNTAADYEPKLLKKDDFNGHHTDNFLPNNNLCENLVSSVCTSENNCVSNDNRTGKYCDAGGIADFRLKTGEKGGKLPVRLAGLCTLKFRETGSFSRDLTV